MSIPRRNLAAGLILVALIIGGAAASLMVWQRQERAAEFRAAVPDRPDLSRWPEAFAQEMTHTMEAISANRMPLQALGRLEALFHANGFSTQALHVVEALERLDPDNAHWSYLRADLHRRANQSVDVETALTRTVKLEPQYAPAWVSLGSIRAQLGNVTAARACFTRAAAIAPTDVRAAFALISFEAHQGNAGDPRRSLTDLLHAHPEITELHLLMADLHEAAANPREAARERTLAERATMLLPDEDPWIEALATACYDSSRLSLMAIKFSRERRWDEAEKTLRRALTFDRSNAALWNLLADAHGGSGHGDEACAVLQEAVVACPEDPDLLVRLAQLLSMVRREQEAADVVARGLGRWPTNAALHAARGFLLRDEQRFTEAAAAFREASRLDPSSVDARFNLGLCLLQTGDAEAGRAGVEAALAMRPNHPDALYVLGNIALTTGQPGDAEAYIQRLRTAESDGPRALRLFATLQLARGRDAARTGGFEAAKQYFRNGLKADPDFAPLLAEAGSFALQQGNHDEAATTLTHLIRVAPADPHGYLLLGQSLAAMGKTREALDTLTKGKQVAEAAGDQSQVDGFLRALERWR